MDQLNWTSGHFAFDLYERSQTEIMTLKTKLPKDEIGSLVEEVLTRIRARGVKTIETINAPSHEQVEKLCCALISDDETEGARFIADVRNDGASLDSVYLCYLAAAARLLGDWWVNDTASFAEVTIGTSRIYSIVRALSHLFVAPGLIDEKSAIFASVPDEDHTLGVSMASDLLSKEGWNIDLKIGLSHDDLVDEIEQSDCRLIGLSAGGRHSAAALARLLIALRIDNPGRMIFVSGQITNEAEDIVSVMGFDGIATDLDAARHLMTQLWDRSFQAAT